MSCEPARSTPMSPSLRALRRAYDRGADEYDRNFASLQRAKYAVMLGEAVESLRIGFLQGRVLDLGCGTGLAFEFVRAFGDGLNPSGWVGLDLSRNMLRHARGRGLPVVQGIAEQLPFRSGSFDVVLAFTSLGTGQGPLGTALREMARVVAPRGFVILTVLARDSSADLFGDLPNAGLEPGSPRPCGQDIGYICRPV